MSEQDKRFLRLLHINKEFNERLKVFLLDEVARFAQYAKTIEADDPIEIISDIQGAIQAIDAKIDEEMSWYDTL